MHKCFNYIPCLLLYLLGVLYEVKPERLMWRQPPSTTSPSLACDILRAAKPSVGFLLNFAQDFF